MLAKYEVIVRIELKYGNLSRQFDGERAARPRKALNCY